MKLLLCFLLSIFILISCKNQKIADRIYTNATILTGDSINTEAKSVAIKDSTILYVGNSYEPYTGSNTEIIDLHGQMLLPGFIDNHTHFLTGGYQLASIDLRKAKPPLNSFQFLKNI